jgi:FSR family fosmidomycin resistance protein-like MFS transporter
LLSSNSILVAMAQELAPQSSGLASSLPLGFSWGLASLTLPFVGHLADQLGVASTLEYLCFLPLPTAALSLLLPGPKRSPVHERPAADPVA